jgi:hypothetical protein
MASVVPSDRLCSFCRKTGHNKRTCAERKRYDDGVRAGAALEAWFDRLEAADRREAERQAERERQQAADREEAAAWERQRAADREEAAAWERQRAEEAAAWEAEHKQMVLRSKYKIAALTASVVGFQVTTVGRTIKNARESIEFLVENPEPGPGIAGLMAPYAYL